MISAAAMHKDISKQVTIFLENIRPPYVLMLCMMPAL
jgi:hypothetical protein